VVRTGSLRTQSARHRVDHGTICGRSCANSGHYKPLCACVDPHLCQSKFVAPASRKNSVVEAGGRGVKFGRPRKMTPHQRQEALQRLNAGETMADLARTYAVDPATISRLAASSPFEHSAVGL
jgi:hypothetical protein